MLVESIVLSLTGIALILFAWKKYKDVVLGRREKRPIGFYLLFIAAFLITTKGFGMLGNALFG